MEVTMLQNSERLLTRTQLAAMSRPGPVPQRKFGRSEEYVSSIGIGGFALRDLPQEEVTGILNRALNEGMNYFDFAPSYPTVEQKAGEVVRARREEAWIVSKTHDRTAEGSRRLLEGTLANLGTDHIDEWRMHNIQSPAELAALFAPGGAMEYAEQARQEGKVRYLSLSSHNPDIQYEAMQRYEWDSMLVILNYLDRFNFPIIWEKLIPYCVEHGIALIGMKAFGDGLLKASANEALRYALSLPSSCVICGVESIAQLEADLAVARELVPVSTFEFASLIKRSPELGTALCRQCGRCLPCPVAIDIPRVFELEGWYDRQLANPATEAELDPAEVAAHKEWFGQKDVARQKASQLRPTPAQCTNCGLCNQRCYYKLWVKEKLREAWVKLAS